MDLLMETARSCDAAVALANDPDADRLGVAIPQADGSWRRLSGDEIVRATFKEGRKAVEEFIKYGLHLPPARKDAILASNTSSMLSIACS